MHHPYILYAFTIFVFGTNWYAIKVQLPHAPIEISILYRTIIATASLVAWNLYKKESFRFSLKDHLYLCGLGLSIFSVHYFFIYEATRYLLSGVLAVSFSLVSFLTILNNVIFFREKPTVRVVLGAFMGIMGLVVFFWHEILSASQQEATLQGLSLSMIGTLIFSFGGIFSKRNSRARVPLIPGMTMAMVYGFVATLLYAVWKGGAYVLPLSPSYWSGVLYSAIPGSIIAFWCYLQLIKTEGPERAGYVTVIFPVVALCVSWMLEGYQWSLPDIIGIILVMSGSVLVMKRLPS